MTHTRGRPQEVTGRGRCPHAKDGRLRRTSLPAPGSERTKPCDTVTAPANKNTHVLACLAATNLEAYSNARLQPRSLRGWTWAQLNGALSCGVPWGVAALARAQGWGLPQSWPGRGALLISRAGAVVSRSGVAELRV